MTTTAPDVCQFDIPGVPVGKGRPRFSTAGKFVRAFTPEKTVRYENLVKVAAFEAMQGRKPFKGPVSVRVEAHFPVPSSWSKKRQCLAYDGGILPTVKPDADNIMKTVCDAMNGIVFDDDKQAVRADVVKAYAEKPGVSVCVYDLSRDG
jgi:Holliday junction resolvase RusA-like endonuclease